MTSSIPVMDLSPWFAASSVPRAALAQAIDDVNRTHGFLVVTGHGVSPSTIAAMDAATTAFFDMATEDKMATHPADPTWSRGYMPLRSRALAYSTGAESPPDLVEYFSIGKPDVDLTDPYYDPSHSSVHYHENIWPSVPAEFRSAWTNYYLELESLAASLMGLFAVAVGLEESWFDDKVNKHCSNLFANHYPEYHGEIEEGQLRLGAHTDYGSLTIVYQNNDSGGLQILSDGTWLDVPVIPGVFVVNIGDLMARWTNDRWKSTLHRVVNPDAGKLHGSRRLSIPFFHQPNYDALIECLPTCQSADNPAKYAPILSGVNMLQKTNATLLA